MVARNRHNHQLYTIGYSGHTSESFIHTLQSKGVRLLIDIRFTPISRKKGFSKTALAESLESVGIAYVHVRQLGSPRSLRQRLIADRDYTAFFESYREYLSEQDESLAEALELMKQSQVCLMCVEAEPHECHRDVVAHALADKISDHVVIKHIPAPTALKPKTAGAERQTGSAGMAGRRGQLLPMRLDTGDYAPSP